MLKIFSTCAAIAITISLPAAAQQTDPEPQDRFVESSGDPKAFKIEPDVDIVGSGGGSDIFKDDDTARPSSENLIDTWPTSIKEDAESVKHTDGGEIDKEDVFAAPGDDSD